MLSPSGPRIAIVGAGYSGALTAVQLARHARHPLEILLLEQSGRFAAGVAYGTESPRHLLNVPAAGMSALPDAPDDFVRWLARAGEACSGTSFVPRRVYRRYLQDVLERETHARRTAITLSRIHACVVDVERRSAGFLVHLGDGRALDADGVVLAPGNFAPAGLPVFEQVLGGSARYVRDPWSVDALAGLAQEDPVLFVGTGLTTVDLIRDLRECGQRGAILAVSRRGLLHRSHRPDAELRTPSGVLDVDGLPRTCRELVRAIRTLVREAEAAGNDWHEVMAALRPLTVELWQTLSLAERRRFLARLRPFWDVHRHLLAPEVALELGELRRSGALRVFAGRILACRPGAQDVRVTVRERGTGKLRELIAARVINCTGPDRDLEHDPNPLLANLQRRGYLRLDPLGLGISTDPDGVLLDGRGAPQPHLYLVGPLRLGDLWECVAVPELRVQAREVALHALGRCEALLRVTQG